MSTTWIKVAYAVLLGVVVAMTVGFGVATFIVPPRTPQPVGISFTSLSDQNASDQQTSHQASLIDSFYKDAQTQRANYPEYQRNIFLTFAGIGLLIAVIGVALPAVVNYLRLGFILGGGMLAVAGIYIAVQPVPNAIPPTSSILTLLGLGQPTVLDTAGRFLRFAVSVVGLLVLIFVGLWRLTDWVMTPRVVMTPAGGVPASVATISAPPATSTAPPAAADRWARPDERATMPPSYTPPAYTRPQDAATPTDSAAAPNAERIVLPTPSDSVGSGGAASTDPDKSSEPVERRDTAPL
jgi:hypothetical protein